MIRANFIASVWISVIGLILLFFWQARGFPQSLSHLGALKNETLIWPAIVLIIQIMLWVAYYRNDENHRAAFIVSVILLTPAIGALASEGVNEIRFSRIELFFLFYVGLSHLLYSLTDWRSWLGDRE